MSFRIVTTVSPSYCDILDQCLPSWYANSGASRIDIHVWGGTWAEHVLARYRIMQQTIHEAAGERVLFMDADCIVLRPLAGGFHGKLPISIARWPNINAGVLFLNMELDWPFADFIDEFMQAMEADYLRLQPSKVSADQDMLETILRAMKSEVHKLDANEWNFPYNVDTTEAELAEHKANMRILHLRVRTKDKRDPLTVTL